MKIWSGIFKICIFFSINSGTSSEIRYGMRNEYLKNEPDPEPWITCYECKQRLIDQRRRKDFTDLKCLKETRGQTPKVNFYCGGLFAKGQIIRGVDPQKKTKEVYYTFERVGAMDIRDEDVKCLELKKYYNKENEASNKPVGKLQFLCKMDYCNNVPNCNNKIYENVSIIDQKLGDFVNNGVSFQHSLSFYNLIFLYSILKWTLL